MKGIKIVIAIFLLISAGLAVLAGCDEESYTVTVYSELSSNPVKYHYSSGSEITLEAKTDREGHKFAGYYLDENFIIPLEEGTVVKQDLNIYVKWSKIYTVQFVTNSDLVINPQSVVSGNKAKEPEEEFDGVFDGWFTDQTFTRPFDFDKPVTSDLILYAFWHNKILTVTLDYGGVIENEILECEYGGTVELNSDFEGYYLVGWFLDPDCIFLFDKDTVLTSGITLYANLKAPVNIKVFKYNATQFTTFKIDYNSLLDLSEYESDSHYTFDGWFINKDFTASVDLSVFKITMDMNFYAKWIGNAPVNIKVFKYNATQFTTFKIDYNSLLDLSEYESDSLYTFDGWFIDKDFTASVDLSVFKITMDMNFYAKWIDPVMVKYFRYTGESTIIRQYKLGTCAEEIEISEPDGVAFAGWFSDIDKRTPYDFSQPLDKNISLYSKWDSIYTVILDPKNGDETATYKVRKNFTMLEPKKPEKEMYIFLGWYTENLSLFNFNTPITRDMYLSARWGDLLEAQFKSEILYIQPDIPMINIDTNGVKITSKDDYISATMDIDSEANEYKNSNIKLEIRGRGSSSWHIMEKKSYRIKLDKKATNIVGFTGYKHYNLISNHADKSLMRNYLAYLFGRVCDTMWSPDTRFVELTINNNYLGLYLLTDAVRVEEGRVDVSGTPENAYDTGFLVEQIPEDRVRLPENYNEMRFVNAAGDQFFYSRFTWWELKYPEAADYSSAHFAGILDYVQEYMDNALGAIISGQRTQFLEYIYEDSFIDYWLIEELFANFDCHQASIFMSKPKGGKLGMDAPWDFDIGANNVRYQFFKPTDYRASNTTIYSSLLRDTTFSNKTAKRVEHLVNTYWKYIMNSIYTVQKSISDAANRNFGRWRIDEDVFQVPDHILAIKTFDGQVDYLSTWLNQRIAWFKSIYRIKT